MSVLKAVLTKQSPLAVEKKSSAMTGLLIIRLQHHCMMALLKNRHRYLYHLLNACDGGTLDNCSQ